ncbi:MAG: DUF4886 domain-containing protein [Ruminococcaceae bacterium]|nr:DUF4886 domain-containing protein [Oscillospiraceae bacterium]
MKNLWKHFTLLFLCICMLSTLFGCQPAVDPEHESESKSEESKTESESEPETEETTDCEHSYSEAVTQKAKALQEGEKTFTCSLCGDRYTEPIEATKSIKILAIGNSFSVDAMRYLWDICNQGGVKTVVLGNLYIGGCTLSTHWKNISNGSAAYTYYKNTKGNWLTTEGKSVQAALAEEDWDIITIQQASGYSGAGSTYQTLDSILSFVHENKTNPDAEVYWHMTWAYQADSTHKDFPIYQNSQSLMYEKIVQCVREQVKTKPQIAGVIPNGTAVQNLRTSYIGDTITRDGYHMNYAHGRYVTALTWYACLTGGSVDAITWVPADYYTIRSDLPVMREAVKNALATPDSVTSSAYPEITDALRLEALGLDIQNYRLIDWSPRVTAFWNSQTGFGINHSGNSTSSVLPYYTASKQFTRTELPVGSLILLDAGYQYRPEGWRSESDRSTASTRPGNVNVAFTQVTEAWWGSYQYRAFNLAHVGSSVAMTEDDSAHFRIYVPIS